jgi:site-specific recombinase XerD
LGRGFAPVSVRQRLSQFRAISRWLEAEQVALSEVTQAHLERFVVVRAAQGRVVWVSKASIALPLEYLRAVGVVAPAGQVSTDGPVDEVLKSYRAYLLGERGLVESNVATYIRLARRFLSMTAGNGRLELLSAAEVTAFVVAECGQCGTALAKKTVTALSSLLRFLHVAGLTAAPLAVAVPKVAGRRSGSLPEGFEAGQVARLLASCDRRREMGRRDYAILTLLARLGLRAGEVAALTLDDIDWRQGEVMIRGKGYRHERLPLPVDVGQAVAAYLQRGRHAPRGCRAVFLRVCAPSGPLGPGGVGLMVARACRRAGVPSSGSHRLRHTAATQMLRHDAPLAEVAQVLRHRSLAVTATYAKIDRGALAELAKPWPGGAA